jgi:hypothetical protein
MATAENPNAHVQVYTTHQPLEATSVSYKGLIVVNKVFINCNVQDSLKI